MSLDDTIARALSGFRPGTVLSFDSLRDAARAAQLTQQQVHGQIQHAIHKGYIEILRFEIDGEWYEACRPTEHADGAHRRILHYRRTATPVPGVEPRHQDAPQVDGQLTLVDVTT